MRTSSFGDCLVVDAALLLDVCNARVTGSGAMHSTLRIAVTSWRNDDDAIARGHHVNRPATPRGRLEGAQAAVAA